MAKHRLTDSARAHSASAEHRRVSQWVYLHWGEQLMDRLFRGDHTTHGSCECRSYAQHQSRIDQPPGFDLGHCVKPLATLLVERHRWDQQMTAYLTMNAPWLSAAEVAAIVAWKPGDRFPATPDPDYYWSPHTPGG